jgi:hypothetical protein
MNRLQNFTKIALSVLFIGVCFQLGCRPKQPIYLTERGRWQDHYISRATNIEFPNVNVQSLSEVCRAAPPLTLANPDPSAMWDLTLEEAIHIALKNSPKQVLPVCREHCSRHRAVSERSMIPL